jgi:Arc/MetJ-type ribon-helix-helix transcriptional regulator
MLRIAYRYADRMVQVVTRMEDDLAAAVDELVAAGVVTSRSDAVRLGLRQLVDRYRREQIASSIVAGYRRQPQSDAEVGWADESTARMIADEPW